MGGFLQDLRYGVRLLTRDPGFTFAAVLSLALGIGANTAIFSLVSAVLLKPLPVTKPDQLVAVHSRLGESNLGRSSYPDYVDVRENCQAFAGVYARSHWPVSVKAEHGKAEVVLGDLVSANYFDVLGVRPTIGRGFLPGEDRPGSATTVAVISDSLWTRLFDSDPQVDRRKIAINDQTFTVIGVGPGGFRGDLVGFAADVWVPLNNARGFTFSDEVEVEARWNRLFDVAARLRDGVTVSQAQASLDVLSQRLAREYPDTNRATGYVALGGSYSRFSIVELGRAMNRFLGVLSGIVALVLLIAASNVANLLLARGVMRQGEVALRLAMGANRVRLMRQFLTESVLLSLVAGAVGILVASWILELFGLIHAPTPVPVSLDVQLDGRVLAYTLLLSLATGVISGLTPAFRSTTRGLADVLRERHGTVRGGGKSARLQSILVTVQVALSLILVISTGLCLKSLQAALTARPGFEIEKGLVAGFNLNYGRYDRHEGRQFQERLLERVRRFPGVASASLSVFPPLSYARSTSEISVDGYTPREGERIFVDNNLVDSGYFETLGIPIMDGRPFDDRDGPGSAPVAVVNETMAQQFWAGRRPVGLSFRTGGGDPIRVVGVARDTKYFQLEEKRTPFYYQPLRQVYIAYFSLHVRTFADPDRLVPLLAAELQELDQNLPPPKVITMKAHMALAQYSAKIVGLMLGSFGFLALVLALTGVYGVMAYTVRQRINEFGIRLALGAGESQIVALVIKRGLVIACAGIGFGLAGAMAAAQLMSSLLYEINPRDPAVFGGVSFVLTAAVLLACYLPARWAARVDASTALRCE